jgi:two-component system, OmpR family, sensor histidine kinase BaeS
MTAPRPLDRLRSIKAKLGVLVAVSVAVSSLAVWYGVVGLGWRPRYTLPVAVLLALGVTQVLARGMTSPLRSMTAAARAMARGDYTRRVEATSRDEVGELARAFNRMAADLEAADRERREMVANVSHELRTPIAALQATLENLVDGVATPDPATLRAALERTERLGRLVRELLDLSRIDAGTEPLHLRDVAVTTVLEAAVAEATTSGRDVRFSLDVSPPEARAWADPGRLHQVLANLLDNAARHSPPGGTVRVTARSDAAGLHVEVADDGPGIAAADRDRVFDRFYRGAGTDGTGSTGLGLAIARWAVGLHGGRIALAPAGETGCRFVVDLPTAPRVTA